MKTVLQKHVKGQYLFVFSGNIFHCWLEINVAQSFKKGMRFGIKYIYVQNKDMNLFKYDIKRRASFNVTKNAVKSGNAVFL